MKKTIRKEILKVRDEIPRGARAIKDSLIKRRLLALSEFREAKTILFYASFRSEVETLSLIDESLKIGKRAVLPKVDRARHMLVLYEIRDVNELTAGYMGIPEPRPEVDKVRSMNDIDLAIIPGAGFDISGNRLGYGAGYYDILLADSRKKIPVVAFAYEEQIIEAIPSEQHDVKMGLIITDQRAIRVP